MLAPAESARSVRALEPPSEAAVKAAIGQLGELQALDVKQSLTPLGHHLATLPVDVRIGKMLLFGCMLRCLHPTLIIAASLSLRSPSPEPWAIYGTSRVVLVDIVVHARSTIRRLLETALYCWTWFVLALRMWTRG